LKEKRKKYLGLMRFLLVVKNEHMKFFITLLRGEEENCGVFFFFTFFRDSLTLSTFIFHEKKEHGFN